MKKLGYALIAAMLIAAPTAQAIEPIDEPAMMFYYSVPFGGGTSREAEMPVYGFRMAMTSTEFDHDTAFSPLADPQRHAMMDLRYSDDGVQGFYINGLNTLTEKSVINSATGESETVTAIDWGLVALGVIGVAALVEGQDGDDDCDPRVTFAGYNPVLGIAIDPCNPPR
jgi:hypothetical protein